MKIVLVSAVALIDADGRVLLAQRPKGKSLEGLWEFPGGKVEPTESVEQALSRELFEELGIEVVSCYPLCQVKHDYGDKQVLLDTYIVDVFKGQPVGKEQQPVAWHTINELGYVNFPAANLEICRAINKKFNNK